MNLREQYCAWLQANGINPGNVPDDAQLTVKRDPDGQQHIHYTEYVRDPATGAKLVDPDEPNQAWRRTASKTLTVPVPPGLPLPPVWHVLEIVTPPPPPPEDPSELSPGGQS